MAETLQQPPLTNDELYQHLDLESQRLQSYNPDLEDTTYVAPEDEALHVASHNWLKNRVDHAETPLVNVSEQGEHVLSVESLHADEEDLEAWIGDSISAASRAIKDPGYARNAMVEAWKKSDPDLTSEDLEDQVGTGELTLSELKDFLKLQNEIPHENTRDKDLHAAGIDVAIALVDSWAKRQDGNKIGDNTYQDDSAITLKLYEAPDGVRPLSGHLAAEKDSFAESFHGLNKEKIERLGQEALNAAGVRERLDGNTESGNQESPTSGNETIPGDEAATKDLFEDINDTTHTTSASEQGTVAENARHSAEQAHNAELINDIVKFGKNRTQLFTDTVASRNGYQEVGDSPRHDFGQLDVPKELIDKFKSRDWREELNEVAMFSDVAEGGAPKLIRNELSGQDEPVVRFRYQFKYGGAALGSAGAELPKYQEFSGGRLGQYVEASLELPKSAADQLQEHIAHDPKSVRALVEQLFLENSGGKVTDESWHQGGKVKHPIRPPYEQLPKDWTMAVVKGAEGSRASDYSVQRVATQ